MNKQRMHIDQQGFTLLEVLLSLSIFTLLSVGSFQLLSSSGDSQRFSEQRITRFNSLNMLFNIIENELIQGIKRPVRGRFGDDINAFIGDSEGFEFTHTGWANRPNAIAFDNANARHSTLQRSAYQLALTHTVESGYIYQWSRMQWAVLDRVQHSEPQQSLQIEVERVRVRYLSKAKVWSDRWPSRFSSNQYSDDQLPIAVEVLIATADFGDIRRLFQVGIYSQQSKTQ